MLQDADIVLPSGPGPQMDYTKYPHIPLHCHTEDNRVKKSKEKKAEQCRRRLHVRCENGAADKTIHPLVISLHLLQFGKVLRFLSFFSWFLRFFWILVHR